MLKIFSKFLQQILWIFCKSTFIGLQFTLFTQFYRPNIWPDYKEKDRKCRKQGCRKQRGWGGCRSVKLISTRVGTFSPPITTTPPGFSDLPTALISDLRKMRFLESSAQFFYVIMDACSNCDCYEYEKIFFAD